MMTRLPRFLLALGLSLLFASTSAIASAQELSTDEAYEIAKEAYIYGFPIVANYQSMHAFAIDRDQDNEQYRAPLNTLMHRAPVTGPDDTAVNTPNIDIAYSFLWVDLRREPLVISVPAVEEGRYYSIQLSDLYSYAFGYIGSRTTGNEAGHYLVAGPNWDGERPAGIDRVIFSESDFAYAVYRMQIRGKNDLETIEQLRSEFRVKPLSDLINQPAPASAPEIDLRPLDSTIEPGLGYFSNLNFLLQFCPTPESDQELMARMSQIGVGAGKTFDASEFDNAVQESLERGIQEGDAMIRAAAESLKVAEVIGTREYLNDDYIKRAVAALRGPFSASKEEVLYPLYLTDAEGASLDATDASYILAFASDDLPPVNAFWSITIYDGATKGLNQNPIGRYQITSSMIPDLVQDMESGWSLFIQHESPEDEREAIWLPAPAGPFYMVMRLYWPKPAAYDGSWAPPLVWRVDAQPTPTSAAPEGAEAAEEVKPSVLVEAPKPELERPTIWGEPTEVQIMIYVVDVDEVNSADQSFAASVYYMARWKNPSLRHKGPGPMNRMLSDVWNPNLTIVGQQSQWKSYPESVVIDPDGTVTYRQKMWGRFSQPLRLRDFPFDRQDLKLHIAAAGHKEGEVKIVPLIGESGVTSSIADDFSLPDFDVVAWKASPEPYYPGQMEIGTVGYSMAITVARQPNYYILKVIIPLCLIVIMSWLPRWIDPEQSGTNIGISTSAFLTLVAYLFAIQILLPRVSYVTRMDRFILLSTLIVFVGLLQTVFNTAMLKQQKHALVEKVERWSRGLYSLLLVVVLYVSLWL